MKKLHTILILITLEFLIGCTKKATRIDFHGYSIGSKVDSSSIIDSEDTDTKFKILHSKSFPNIVLRTYADTVISIMANLNNEDDALNLIEEINTSLNRTCDSTYYPVSAQYWEDYEYSWKDPYYGDMIRLVKSSRIGENEFHWYLEITNDSLFRVLDLRYDKDK